MTTSRSRPCDGCREDLKPELLSQIVGLPNREGDGYWMDVRICPLCRVKVARFMFGLSDHLPKGPGKKK